MLKSFRPQTISFVLPLVIAIMLAVWLIMRMVIHTDPDVPANVAVVLLLVFVAAGSLTSLLSWGLIRRIAGEERFGAALRHGVWGGALLVALPLLRWLDALSPLVVGALLLIVCGLESLILLQRGQGDEPGAARDEAGG